MFIAIVGAGYVGLVSGACLADAGHKVLLVDNDPARIAKLERGEMPIYEPGLDTLVHDNVSAGRLSFATDLPMAVAFGDVIVIAVGTPQGANGAADLTYVRAVAAEIGRSLPSFAVDARKVIVTKSTVPVGTGDEVEAILRSTAPHSLFDVVSNPEFLREGAAIADFKQPDRVVVGAESASAAALMRELYRPITERVIVTSRRTAELAKYAANAFLATKITFINEIADLCEEVGADIDGVSRAIGTDRRIGPDFLRPGPGYGGSCFPKDTMALSVTAEKAGVSLSLVDTTIAVNAARKRAMGHRIVEAMGGSVDGRIVALLGLTFKAGTDDMRDSPAIDIVDVLQEHGAHVSAYDPEGMTNAATVLEDVLFNRTALRACEDADAVVIATEWSEFRTLDLEAVARVMAGRTLVDLRNIVDPAAARAAGLDLTAIGRR